MHPVVLKGHKPWHLPWLGKTLRAQYWGAWLSDERLARACKNSRCFWLCLADGGRILENEEPVGFARVMSDYGTFSALMDVVVVPEWRGKGHGKALIKAAIECSAVSDTICVLASRNYRGLYAKFGFFEVGGELMQRNPGKLAE